GGTQRGGDVEPRIYVLAAHETDLRPPAGRQAHVLGSSRGAECIRRSRSSAKRATRSASQRPSAPRHHSGASASAVPTATTPAVSAAASTAQGPNAHTPRASAAVPHTGWYTAPTARVSESLTL